MTMNRDDVRRLYAYHAWSYDRLFPCVADMSADQLDARSGGSFGTLRGLLTHILGSEKVWLSRWRGRPLSSAPIFSITFAGQDFCDVWQGVRQELSEYLDSLADDALSREFEYVTFTGDRRTMPFGDVLLHVVNHGTYHRGQLAHVLRDVGRVPPSTDYSLFCADLARHQAQVQT